MKIKSNYNLAAASNESKVLVKIAKAAYEDTDKNAYYAQYKFNFVFNFFYKKKYNKQELISICLDALCGILDLNATLAKEYRGDITKFTEADYYELIRNVIDINYYDYSIEYIMLKGLDDFDALYKALYKSFKEYIKANSDKYY